VTDLFFTSKGTGRPIVLLHGFCETHEIWRGVQEGLASRYRVITPDLPGFGGSTLPTTPFTLDGIADLVISFLNNHAIENAVVIGHSLGGYVTLAMANRNPGLFAGAGLFHSTAYPDAPERKANRDKTIEFVKRHGVAPFVETYVPGLFYDKQHAAMGEVKRIALQTTPETLVAYSMAMRDRPSRIEFLKHYSKPFLFLAGTEDTFVPLASMEEQHGLVANGALYLLPATGHMGMYERVGDSVEFINDFVSRQVAL
jgi:pimeloyl-ACP methyl ester carboxylesterase